MNLVDLNKTWSIITQNRNMKTDAQVINFFRAIQHGKNLVKEVTPEMISSMAQRLQIKLKELISYLI